MNFIVFFRSQGSFKLQARIEKKHEILAIGCEESVIDAGLQTDVIMFLAGSNGGSWSTTFSPKSAANSSRAVGPGDRVSTIAGKHLACYIVWSEIRWLILGAHQGSIFAKDTRNPVQLANPSSEDKRPQ
ncbi:hypothetical protein P8452_14071 [Trifolium repens]|nr:hypothetical protein P8452_14071 [Trifolium repens]